MGLIAQTLGENAERTFNQATPDISPQNAAKFLSQPGNLATKIGTSVGNEVGETLTKNDDFQDTVVDTGLSTVPGTTGLEQIVTGPGNTDEAVEDIGNTVKDTAEDALEGDFHTQKIVDLTVPEVPSMVPGTGSGGSGNSGSGIDKNLLIAGFAAFAAGVILLGE